MSAESSSFPRPLFLDVLMPGRRGYSNKLVIEPSPELATWKLVCCGTHGHGPATIPIVPGEPFTFGSKWDTRIFVVPPNESLPTMLSMEWLAAHMSVEPPVDSPESVPYYWPAESTVTTLRIQQLDEHALVFEVVRQKTTYSYPQLALWIGVGALFVGGVVGLFLLRRRQRAKSGAACSRC